MVCEQGVSLQLLMSFRYLVTHSLPCKLPITSPTVLRINLAENEYNPCTVTRIHPQGKVAPRMRFEACQSGRKADPRFRLGRGGGPILDQHELEFIGVFEKLSDSCV